MKYYIIAGEASGDLHGSNLMKSLLKKDKNADFRFWGGDLMASVSDGLVKHYRSLAFMGFWEVITNIRAIFQNIKFCKKDILSYNPDAIIFIDYPGFNMKIAKWAKEQGFSTHYYISPKIWAWKENRIHAIRRDIDFMYVIFPFEKDYYLTKHNYSVEFVGNPLLDSIERHSLISTEEFVKKNNLSNKPIIAILPGSRKQEISKMLSVMLSVTQYFTDYQFVIAGTSSIPYEFYKPFLNENVTFISGQTYDLLNASKAALVTSGTATLETALWNVPQVVCYKGNWISYQIAKRIISLKYISLVNLILDKKAVTELIQNDLNTENIRFELQKILTGETRKKILNDYKTLQKKLGGSGASNKVANLIVHSLQT